MTDVMTDQSLVGLSGADAELRSELTERAREVRGAEVSKQTISTITDPITEGLAECHSGPPRSSTLTPNFPASGRSGTSRCGEPSMATASFPPSRQLSSACYQVITSLDPGCGGTDKPAVGDCTGRIRHHLGRPTTQGQ